MSTSLYVEEIAYFENVSPTGRTICIPINQTDQSKNAIDFAIKKVINKSDMVTLLNCRKVAMQEYAYAVPYGLIYRKYILIQLI